MFLSINNSKLKVINVLMTTKMLCGKFNARLTRCFYLSLIFLAALPMELDHSVLTFDSLHPLSLNSCMLK